MTITEAVAVRLAQILRERGMTKKEFKDIPGVNAQSISNLYRSNRTPSISMTTLYRICVALDMSMSRFLNHPVFDHIDNEE